MDNILKGLSNRFLMRIYRKKNEHPVYKHYKRPIEAEVKRRGLNRKIHHRRHRKTSGLFGIRL